MERIVGRGRPSRARAHPLALNLALVRPVRVRVRGLALIPTPRGGRRAVRGGARQHDGPAGRASGVDARGGGGGRVSRVATRARRAAARDAVEAGGHSRAGEPRDARHHACRRHVRCLSPLVSEASVGGEESDASSGQVVSFSVPAPDWPRILMDGCFTSARRVHHPSRAHRFRSFAARSASSRTRVLIPRPLPPARTTHVVCRKPRRRQLCQLVARGARLREHPPHRGSRPPSLTSSRGSS